MESTVGVIAAGKVLEFGRAPVVTNRRLLGCVVRSRFHFEEFRPMKEVNFQSRNGQNITISDAAESAPWASARVEGIPPTRRSTIVVSKRWERSVPSISVRADAMELSGA